MGGVDWKAWQEDQDKRNGPNARPDEFLPVRKVPREELKTRYPKKKVLTAQDLKPAEPSPDFPDTVDD